MPKNSHLPTKAKRSEMSVDDKLEAIMDQMSADATARDEAFSRIDAIERRMLSADGAGNADDEETQRSDDYLDDDADNDTDRSEDGDDAETDRSDEIQEVDEDEEDAAQRSRRAAGGDRNQRAKAEKVWDERVEETIRKAGKADPGKRQRGEIRNYVLAAPGNKRKARLESMVQMLGEAPPMGDDDVDNPITDGPGAGGTQRQKSAMQKLINALPPHLKSEVRTLRRQYKEYDAAGVEISEYAFVYANITPQLTSAQRSAFPQPDYAAVDETLPEMVDEKVRETSGGRLGKAHRSIHNFLAGTTAVLNPGQR